jgi:hypothetical protein
MEGIGGEQLVEALVEPGILEAVAGDEQEDSVEGQHAQQAALVQGGGQEVCAGKQGKGQ